MHYILHMRVNNTDNDFYSLYVSEVESVCLISSHELSFQQGQ